MDGKLNVMGIFTHIFAPEFPARHPSSTLVTRITPDVDEYDAELEFAINLIGPDAETVWNFRRPIKLPPPHNGRPSNLNVIHILHDLVFPAAGRYEFKVLIDNQEKADMALDAIVRVETAPPTEQ